MLLPADNTESTMARTPKARALGGALRQARTAKGMVLRELASAINRDIGVVSRWETGDRTPKPEQVAQILTTLGVGGDRYEEIMTLAYGTDESQWVATTLPEQRQQMAAYIDWEQSATRIVEVAPLLVPGLLQISDYIQAIMTAGGVPDGEIASRVTGRIGRRDVIEKAKPARLLVLLGQNVLNNDIGGREVTIAQARHLLEMAARPNIEIRIIPDHSGWHPDLEGPFTLVEVDPSERGSIVFMETRRSILMMHEDEDVDAYKQAVDRVMPVVLSPATSIKFLADMAHNRLERK
ncbi:MAG TPA: helix-turn-helix transcriptional regulator [Pseudonocardiaceae bacterium]|nr:helix-turn-helix transcriptional regulator [Pseudonocardiaceae bacterium]